MHYKTLANTSLEVLRTTFGEAFSDYEIPIHLTTNTLLEMMGTRDLSLEHSVGTFDGKRLVGFILCGYRKSRTGATLYDGGTGVVPDYRGKGIAADMLSWILREADRKGIDRFLLEVLEHNRAAQELYLKAGFSNRRFFRCYRLDKDLVGQQVLDSPYFFEPLEKTRFEKFDHHMFLSYEPSWQNDVPSVLHNWEQLAGLSVICDGKLVGYGLVHRIRGDIPQIALAEGYAEKIFGCIISALSRLTESPSLSVVNIEEGSREQQLLVSLGWENHINQFEMLYGSDGS